jgi:hypothetical protein
MTSMASYDDDIRAIAHAYIGRHGEGTNGNPAFVAAVDAYRRRHPETDNCEAALTVSNLLQEMPRSGCK